MELCTLLNATTEDCATTLTSASTKLWVLYLVYAILFFIIQVFIISMFTRKKSTGFWLGVITLGTFNIFVIIMFILMRSQIMIALGLI